MKNKVYICGMGLKSSSMPFTYNDTKKMGIAFFWVKLMVVRHKREDLFYVFDCRECDAIGI